MLNDVALRVTEVFLALNVASLLSYLWQRPGRNLGWALLSPMLLAALGVIALIIAAVTTFFLGLDWIIFAVALGIGVSISLTSPTVAACHLLAYLVLRPWELYENDFLAILPRGLAILAVVPYVLQSVAGNQKPIVWNRAYSTFVALVFWLLISLTFTQGFKADFAQVGQTFFPIAVLAFLVFNCIDSGYDLMAFVRSVAIAMTGVVTSALYLTLGHDSIPEVGVRLFGAGLFGNTNDVAALIAFVIPLILFPFALRAKSRFTRVSSWLTLAVLGKALWLSQSRGVLLAAVASGLAYILFCQRSMGRALLIMVVCLGLPILAYLNLWRDQEELAGSQSSRLNYTLTAFRMLKDSPLFGVGMGNYTKLYNRYTQDYYEEGERTAHSSWVLILAEAGPIGLLLFGYLYLLAVTSAWRVRHTAPEFLVMTVSYGVTMSFLSHSYWILPYLMVVLAVAAAGVLVDRTENSLKE